MLSEKTSARAATNPLPPKLAALVREFWWLALLGLALYLVLILYTYSKADPGWSHSTTVDAIHNAGGRVGAWLADVLLYVFGLSAYWWIVLCGVLVWWGFHRIEGMHESDRRSYVVATVGFAVVLFASSGLEAGPVQNKPRTWRGLSFRGRVALTAPRTPGRGLGAVHCSRRA